MPRLLRCANGHEWEASADQTSAAGSAVAACPICGAAENTAPVSEMPRLGDTVTATPPFFSPVQPPPPVPVSHRETAPLAEREGYGFPAVAGYEILEELGHGGMGVVYRAREVERDRIVALKVIRRERLSSTDTVNRFRREAQAAARLSHPNIVAVYASDQDGDIHYLAMEYVPGITLQQLVDRNGPLPIAQACDFVRQTALGLQHAAEQALVHRDVKPANLMVVATQTASVEHSLRECGPEGTRSASAPHSGGSGATRPLLKILDMGVARLYQLAHAPEESLTTLTRDGAVIGTPDYVAPEQLEDPHGADIRADLYSLGCTFYFLLTGKVPFPGGTLIQKLDRQRKETPPSVDQLRSEVPLAVAAVVRRLMAKSAAERYRTPGELAGVLEHLAQTGQLPGGHQPAPLHEEKAFTGHTGQVNAVAFAPNGQTVVSGAADRTIRVWDVASGKQRHRYGESAPEPACLAVVPGTGHILAGHGIGIRLWEAATGRELLRLAGHTDTVRGVAVSRDGQNALSGGDDRTPRLWDLTTGREAHRLVGHKGRVTGVALSADGRLAVTGDRDSSLRLWDAKTGRELRSFAVPKGAVLAVALSPDGRAVLSAHFDTTLRLWDRETGRELRRFTGHKQMVSCVAVSPDGARLASGSHDGTVRVWDPVSGSELWCCQGHSGAVLAVAFAPDGKRLLSGGADQTLRLWQMPG
jgi:serine/threonine protein kinase